MSVTALDLIAPRGEVEPNFFPSEAPQSRLQEYINEALAKIASYGLSSTDADEAVKNWAYHRAFKALYLRLSADPSSATLNDQGARVYTSDQISRFRTISSDYLSAFQAFIPASTPVAQPTSPTSTHLRNSFTW